MTQSLASLLGSILDTARMARRWLAAIGILAVVATLGVVGGVPAATATTAPFAPVTSFAIDGDIIGANDWGNPPGSSFPTRGTTPGGLPTAGIVESAFQTDPCNGADTTGYPGSQTQDTNPWVSGTASPNKKADLCWGGAAIEVVKVGNDFQYVFYGAWSRDPSATGDLSIFYTLQGPLAGRVDDVLISFDYDPAGGGTIAASVLRWNTGSNSWTASSLSNTAFQAAVGRNLWPAIGGAPTANTATFGEFAVNLTTSGILPVDSCRTFSLGNSISRTGNSSSAQLQDNLAYPSTFQLNSCGNLQVQKETNPPNTSGGPFGYRITQVDGRPVYDAALVTDPGEPDLSPGAAAIDGQLTVTADLQDSYTNILGNTAYRITEPTMPSGWALQSRVCAYYDVFTGTTVTKTLTPTDDTFQVPSSTLAPAGTLCTLTNSTSNLIVNKAGAGNPATQFPIAVSGSPSGTYNLALGGTTGVINYAPGTQVTITETLPTTGIPWTTLGIVCKNRAGTTVASGTTTSLGVTTVGGDTITCTVTNQQQAQIVLQKDFRPDPAAATTESATFTGAFGSVTLGDGVRGGVPGAPGTTGTTAALTVAPNVGLVAGATAGGPYTVTEVSATGSYSLGAVLCLDNDSTGDLATRTATYRVSPGEIVVCRFANVAPGSITIVKNVDPDSLQDFTFTTSLPVGTFQLDNDGGPLGGVPGATDDLLPSRTFTNLAQGSYTFEELQTAAGFSLTGLTCADPTNNSTTIGAVATVNLDVQAGGQVESVTCTYTNTRASAQLTLTKAWVGGASGDAVNLTASGTEVVGGVSGSSVVGTGGTATTSPAVLTIYSGDTINLSELFTVGDGSYRPTLSCRDANGTTTTIPLTTNGATSNGTYAVPTLPTNVTCTFTNTARTANLTLTKSWGSSPVNGATVDLTIEGVRSSATGVNSNDGNATNDTVAARPVIVGRTVLLKELFRRDQPAGSGHYERYRTTLECTVDGTAITDTAILEYFGVDPVTLALEGALTIDPSFEGKAIACRFVNERRTTSFTLYKQWIYAHPLDAVNLTVDSIETRAGAPGTDTSPAPSPAPVGGDQTVSDFANAITVTAYSDELINLSESFVGTPRGSYFTTLTCVDSQGVRAAVEPSADQRTGTFRVPDVPDTSYTCRFQNSRLSEYLFIQKQWVGGENGDSTSFTGTGLQSGQTDTATSTSGGQSGAWLDQPDWTANPDPNTGVGNPTNGAIVYTLTGGTVRVTETLTTPSNHPYASTLACSYTTPANTTPTATTVTANPDGDTATRDWNVAVPVEVAATTVCTISNVDAQPQLTLVKTVTNDSGGARVVGDFPLTASNGTTTLTGVSGTADVTAREVPAGTYLLSETALAGYAASTWSCTNAANGGTVTFTAGTAGSGTGNVTLVTGDVVTCAITNDDQPATLRLDKVLTTDNGGDATSADFPLSATPTTTGVTTSIPATGDTNPAAGTSVSGTLSAGTYTLAETGVAGYAAGSWSCVLTGTSTPVSVTGTSVTLANGTDVTCTITNNDEPVDIAIAKTTTSTTAVPGQTLTYTLAVWNQGARAADAGENVTVTDSLPTGLTVNSVTAPTGVSCTAPVGGTSVTCTIPASQMTAGMTQGTAVNITVVANVSASIAVPGTVVNLATAGNEDDQPPADPTCPPAPPSNNVACNSVPLVATVTLLKTVVNDNGGNAVDTDWTLSLTDTTDGSRSTSGREGQLAVTGWVIDPSHAFTLAESGPAGYTRTNLACTGATVNGEAITITQGTVVCTFTNDDEPVDLQLTKSDGGVTLHAGLEFDYTLTVSNRGTRPVDATEPVTVTDQLPAGLSFVSSVSGCTAAGSLVTCQVSPAAINAGPVSLTITVRVNADATPGPLTNRGVVTTTDDPAPSDPTCPPNSNNVACVTTNLAAPTLTLQKVVTSPNGGTATVADFTLTATGPTAGVSGVTGAAPVTGRTVAPGSYALTESVADGYQAVSPYVCTTRLTGTSTVLATAISNTVVVGAGTDVTCVVTNTDGSVNLVLDKTDNDAKPLNGQVFAYTITVTNTGDRMPSVGNPVTVTDKLPAGIVYVSGPSTCSAAGQTVTCALDPHDLFPGNPVPITIQVKFSATAAAGDYTNIAWVTTPEDPAPTNPTCPVDMPGGPRPGAAATPDDNVDCEMTTLGPVRGLGLAKLALENGQPSDGKVDFGQTIVYRITATATGNSPQAFVEITDPLPAGLTLVAGSQTCDAPGCVSSYDAATRTVKWTVPTMSPGATVVVLFSATVDAPPTLTAGQTYTWEGKNVAAVASAEVPKTPSNEVLSLTYLEVPAPPLAKTGADVFAMMLGAFAALGAGVMLLLIARRRRQE